MLGQAMPLFKIIPTDPDSSAIAIDAIDAGAVLNIVQKLDCAEADVFEDGVYRLSVRLRPNGPWCIFQRDGVHSAPTMTAFG